MFKMLIYIGERSKYGTKLVNICQGSNASRLLIAYTIDRKVSKYAKYDKKYSQPYVINTLNNITEFAAPPCFPASNAHLIEAAIRYTMDILRPIVVSLYFSFDL